MRESERESERPLTAVSSRADLAQIWLPQADSLRLVLIRDPHREFAQNRVAV